MIIIMPITTTAPILVTLEKKIKKGRKEDKEEEKKSINQELGTVYVSAAKGLIHF